VFAVPAPPPPRKGTQVFYVRRAASFVLPATLLGVRGSDASNQFDQEVAAEVRRCPPSPRAV
jgi:hypothetical protein